MALFGHMLKFEHRLTIVEGDLKAIRGKLGIE